ncbi:MAG: NAD(P)H-dependent oxidoreductase subunit E [Spirochaetes bacterium]|nr:NAD(P)H-dependent oxidoreductase subunit E [Spirochaetota bacterium]
MSSEPIDQILVKYKDAKRDALIPLLQEIQEAEQYLSVNSLKKISQQLSIPLSKIYGVASFYNQFKFHAPGKYHIQICRGTACHVKGSARVMEALLRELQINAGETTKDGLFSLELVSCVGVCSLAPVICVNDHYHTKVKPDQVNEIINSYREKEKQS